VLLFLIRRLGGLVATILVATMVVFAVLELLPGDPASLMLGVNAQPDTVAALRREVLASEIACEHGEQLIIAGAAEALPDAPRTMEAGEAVVANVLAYCVAAGLRLERSDAQALATVFAAKLPDPDANLAAAQVLDSLG
jgi:hypothetical protein